MPGDVVIHLDIDSSTVFVRQGGKWRRFRPVVNKDFVKVERNKLLRTERSYPTKVGLVGPKGFLQEGTEAEHVVLHLVDRTKVFSRTVIVVLLTTEESELSVEYIVASVPELY